MKALKSTHHNEAIKAARNMKAVKAIHTKKGKWGCQESKWTSWKNQYQLTLNATHHENGSQGSVMQKNLS